MDNPGKSFLDLIPLENLKLQLNQDPFVQNQDKSWSINRAVYSDYDLFICQGGEALFTLHNNQYLLTEGKALLVAPGIEISAEHKGTRSFDAVAHHFSLSMFDTTDFLSLIKYTPYITFENWDFIRNCLEYYVHLYIRQSKSLVCHSLFFSILSEFLYASYLSENKPIDEKTSLVLSVVKRLDKDFKIHGIASSLVNECSYSPDYTIRIFKEKIGMTPKQYVITRRLRLSKEYLTHGKSVKESAFMSGFNDELYFSRLFKKYEGITPSDYQGREKQDNPENSD